jgi:hypothetical protein
MLGLFHAFECPYCPRTGEGIVAVDLDQACAGISSPREHWEINLASGVPGGIVLFNPDGHQIQPCKHLISLLIDVEVIRTTRKGGVERPVSYTANYDHSWFATNDPEDDYSEFLWTEVNGGDERAFHPVTPFQIRNPRNTWKVSRSRWRLEISGTLFVAMEPEVFLEQLRSGYLNNQEFCTRRRAL